MAPFLLVTKSSTPREGAQERLGFHSKLPILEEIRNRCVWILGVAKPIAEAKEAKVRNADHLSEGARADAAYLLPAVPLTCIVPYDALSYNRPRGAVIRRVVVTALVTGSGSCSPVVVQGNSLFVSD